jgi:hypothetical protein
MNLQMDIFGRYFELTDGHNLFVLYSACHNDRRMYRRISLVSIPNIQRQLYRRFLSVGMSHHHRRAKILRYISSGKLFFRHAIFVCKTIDKCFFCFPDRAMESGITDERKADRRIPSMRMSINILLMKP